MGIFDGIKVRISEDQAESLICFIKQHEREEIPDDVWEFCLYLQDELEIF